MNREAVVEIIKAINPYVRLDKDAVIAALISDRITEFPDDLVSQDENILLALALRDIEGGTAGVLPDWQKVVITQITLKKSSSGNETYYCDMVDSEGNALPTPLYLGTTNGYKKMALDVYPELDEMPLNSVATDVQITAYVTQSNRFYELQRIEPNGILNFDFETESQRKNRVITEYIEDLYSDPDTVYLDTETTALNGEICQISISSGSDTYTTYIMPKDPARLTEKDKKGKCASDFNGITPDMLDGAPTFPEVYSKLKTLLEGKKVVIYNADFDKGRLDADIARHNLEPIEYTPICLMKIYAEYNGEVTSRGFKSIKLGEAYQSVVGSKMDGAHQADNDVHAMQEIVKHLYNIHFKQPIVSRRKTTILIKQDGGVTGVTPLLRR